MGPCRSSIIDERQEMTTPTASTHLTRRSFLIGAVGAITFLVTPRSAQANDFALNNTDDVYLSLTEDDLSSADAFFAAVDELGVGWDHYKTSPSGSLDLAAHYSTFQEAQEGLQVEARGVVTKILEIIVKVGSQILGYLKVKVDIGSMIVTEIISAGAHYLLQQAADYFINRRYQAVYTLPCSVYPPHSGEYIRCINS